VPMSASHAFAYAMRTLRWSASGIRRRDIWLGVLIEGARSNIQSRHRLGPAGQARRPPAPSGHWKGLPPNDLRQGPRGSKGELARSPRDLARSSQPQIARSRGRDGYRTTAADTGAGAPRSGGTGSRGSRARAPRCGLRRWLSPGPAARRWSCPGGGSRPSRA
jgi:hypothetical protein